MIYRDWELSANAERTRRVYAAADAGSAERCGCSTCKNFIALREKIYPVEIRRLFEDIGVDFRKEAEISHFAKLENGLHYYSGWFHFIGAFIGKDCTVPLPNGGHSLDLTPIDDGFAVGFRRDRALTFFEADDDIIQIEFEAQLPWVIDPALENA
jgi:hypothetical protein